MRGKSQPYCRVQETSQKLCRCLVFCVVRAHRLVTLALANVASTVGELLGDLCKHHFYVESLTLGSA